MAKYHIFWKFLAKKHYFENKWERTTFSRTWVSETRVSHQFCHRRTTELEFVRLKKIMWYSSLVNSSTMQHSTRVYQARVPFFKNKKKIYTILEFGKLEYCVIFFFFFWDNQQINIKIKISSFFYVFIYLNRSIVKYRDFNFKIWI